MAWKDLQSELAEEFSRLEGCSPGAYDKKVRQTSFLPTADQVQAWKKENPQRWKEICKRYYAKNKDEINARARARRKADPEKYREQDRKKRERRRVGT